MRRFYFIYVKKKAIEVFYTSIASCGMPAKSLNRNYIVTSDSTY